MTRSTFDLIHNRLERSGLSRSERRNGMSLDEAPEGFSRFRVLPNNAADLQPLLR